MSRLSHVELCRTPQGAAERVAPRCGSRGTKHLVNGDADILVRYLEAQDAEDYYVWVKWSEKNANLAKAFWPAVSRLAQEEQYVFIPDLFELAKSGRPIPWHFKPRSTRKSRAAVVLGQQLQEAEEHRGSQEAARRSSQLDASNPLIRRAAENRRERKSAKIRRPSKLLLPQPRQRSRKHGQHQTDGDDEQEHAHDVLPGVGILGLEFLAHVGSHVHPDVVLAVRIPVIAFRRCHITHPAAQNRSHSQV